MWASHNDDEDHAMHRLPPAGAQLRLEAHETLLATARAGTWLQVRSGVLIVQPPMRWLGECMVAPVHRLGAGAELLLDEDGWWRFAVDTGPVELQCVRPVGPAGPRWLGRWLQRCLDALRETTRRTRPS